MKLVSLKLKNFRRFFGEQDIEFSIKKDKKITLIHAENGVGKTNILRAVHWAMYGELIAMKKKDKAGIPNSTHLINVEHKKESFECYVLLKIEKDGQIYELKRTLEKKDSEKNDLKIWFGKEEKRVKREELLETIERILPKGLAKYFFFQGESLEDMTESGENIGKAISNIQGIDDANQVLNYLKKYHKTLSNEYVKKIDIDADSKNKKVQIDRLEDSINKKNKRLEEIKTERAKANKNVKLGYDVLKKLSSEVIKLKLKEREVKSKQLPIKKKALESHLLTKNKSIQDFYSGVMTAKVAEESSKIKDDLRLKGKFPHKLSFDLITKIFKEKNCICDRCVEVGSDEWKAIEEWNKEAGDPELTDRFGVVGNISQTTKRFTEMFRDSMQNHEAISNSFEEDIKLLKSDLDALKQYFDDPDKDPDKAVKFENLVLSNEKLRDGLNDEFDLLTESKESELKELAPKLKEYENLINKSSMPESEKKRIQFLKSAKIRMDNIINSQQNEAEEFIKKDLQRLISEHASKSFELDFDSNFVPSLKEKNIGGIMTDADESKGELLLLNIAFVTSMIEYSKYRRNLSISENFTIHGLEAPLLLDAPFGDAQSYQQNIADILVNSPAEQVIIMCAKGFYEGAFNETVNEKIGSRYILENHAIESEIKKEFKKADQNGLIYINGKKHKLFFKETEYGWSQAKKVNG
tara:strand:- start:2919 stop:5003 length:2085 start_codon:yes stop_codon:yes gene_type:complete